MSSAKEFAFHEGIAVQNCSLGYPPQPEAARRMRATTSIKHSKAWRNSRLLGATLGIR
jgi:hypothetical protein